MKCKACGKKINWDNSVGRLSFLVCNDCVEKIHQSCNIPRVNVLGVILWIGFKKEEKEK